MNNIKKRLNNKYLIECLKFEDIKVVLESMVNIFENVIIGKYKEISDIK